MPKKKSPEGLLVVPAADDRIAEIFVVQGVDDTKDRYNDPDESEYDQQWNTDQHDDEQAGNEDQCCQD